MTDSTAPSLKKKGNKNLMVAAIAVVVVVALVAVIILGGFLNAKAAPKTGGSMDYLFPGLKTIKERGSIVMATEATFIPFESYDPVNKTFVGFDIDLANKITENISALLGVPLQLEIRDVAFSGIPASLAAKQYDMSLSGMTITDERNETILFSTPYYMAEAGFGLLVKSDNTNIHEEADLLNAESIVVNTGTTSELWLKEKYIDTHLIPSEKVKSLPTIAGCVQDVQIGQSEVFIIDKPTAETYADKPDSGLKVSGVIPSFEPYGVALNKEANDLKVIIDMVINKMMANGEMEQLRIKWGLS